MTSGSTRYSGGEYKRGLQEGVEEGVQKGELALFRCLLEKRLGELPGWADQRLQHLSTQEIESLGLKLFESNSLDELLG
jgi:hypothetical protein